MKRKTTNGSASEVKNDLIDGALKWAANGVPVFPCSGNKRPLTKNGFYDASTDPVKVKELFEFYGNDAKMIGARMGADAGMFAIDFDLYKELEAKSFMEDLINKGILPNTRIHKTKNGGVHMFYTGDAFPNLNPVDGVEVKGEGGYVIMPPSPGYEVMQEGIIDAPDDLITALLAKYKTQRDDTVSGLKEKIRTAANFHDSLARLAARLSAMGWTPEQVQAELTSALMGSVAASPEHARHSRWQKLMENAESEVTRIVGTSHAKYNSRAASDDLGDTADLEKLKKLGEKAGFKSPPQRGERDERHHNGPRPKSVEDFSGAFPFLDEGYFAHHDHDILEQRFIMHPLLCEDESILIAAEPKTGKTAVALTVGLHIATGLDLGKSLRVAEPRGVLYFALEGRRAIRLRIAAWRRYRSELGETLPDFIPLFVVERSKNLLHEVERQNLANAIAAAAIWMEREHGIALGLIVIDTYTKAMPGGDQNSVEDTSSVFDVVGRVRDLNIKASVAFIHHKARAGHVRGSTNIEADPDVLTSIYKDGDIVKWSLDRARSVEEGGTYHFKLQNYNLGTSGQGFAINAPVVEAIDASDAEGPDLDGAKSTNKAMTLILSLGGGRHTIKKVYDTLLEAGLAPSGTRRARSKLPVDGPKVQEWINGLIPDTGYVFSGRPIEKVIENGSVVAIFIR